MSENPSPYVSPLMDLKKDWIDYNGHLNMAYYNVLFDQGSDGAFAEIGLGPDYIKERNLTFYTAEAHVRYVREIHLGDRVRVTIQFVDFDTKRVHAYSELHHEDGWLSATCETMSLHIDMSGPKVAPFPDDVFKKLQTVAQRHASVPRSDNIGRSIGIVRKG